MKVLIFLTLFGLSLPLHAGTIVGTVRAEGAAETAESGKGGKYDSRKFKFVERLSYDELEDFVVYVDYRPTNSPAVPAKPVQVITQRDATFRPHVLPIVKGTTVEWPNKDEIFHNVFSMSEAKEFDLGLYRDPEVKKVTFDKAGRIDVFCSIHSKMNCVVLVLENPWFATADKSGRFRIENVPPGTYKLKAWHERVPPQSIEITVPEKGEVRADFVLGVKNLPKL
jgi:plastocyanin